MTNKDVLRQYCDVGMKLPNYQVDKLNPNLLKTYLRKRVISAELNSYSYIDNYEFFKMDLNMQSKAILYTRNLYDNLPIDIKKKTIKNISNKNYTNIFKDTSKEIYVYSVNDYDNLKAFINLSDYDFEHDHGDNGDLYYVIFDLKEDYIWCISIDDSNNGEYHYLHGTPHSYRDSESKLDTKLFNRLIGYSTVKSLKKLDKVKDSYKPNDIIISFRDDDDEFRLNYSNIIPICDASLRNGEITQSNEYDEKRWYVYIYKKYAAKLLHTLDMFDFNTHLDTIFNFYQNVKYVKTYSTYNNNSDREYIKYEVINLNIFDYLSTNYIDDIHFNDKYLIQLKEMFIKVLYSSIKLNNDTKRIMFSFLRKHDVDILNLVKQIKAKKGDDLTDSEFGMLNKKGDNLDTIISNKMNKIRKGDDIQFTDQEILYAVDNGYEKYFKKYYTQSLKDDTDQAIDYDLMRILKKLNLIPETYKLIKHKVNEYGVDSLNSIEKSIYDTESRN